MCFNKGSVPTRRLEAIASRLEAIAIRFVCVVLCLVFLAANDLCKTARWLTEREVDIKPVQIFSQILYTPISFSQQIDHRSILTTVLCDRGLEFFE